MSHDDRQTNELTANDALFAAVVLRAHRLERLQSHDARAILHMMDRTIFEPVAKMVKDMKQPQYGENFARVKRYAAIRRAINEVVRSGYSAIYAELKGRLGIMAESEGVWAQNSLKRAIGEFQVPVQTINKSAMKTSIVRTPYLGQTLIQDVGAMSARTRSQIAKQVSLGVAAGEDTAAISRRLVGTRVNPGIYKTLRRNMGSLIATSHAHVAAQAREAVYEANADILRGVQWVSVLDGRTTDICIGLDGQIFGLKDGPRPPAHIRCRSTTVPVMRSWRDLAPGEAGAKDWFRGVEANQLTYQEWLQRQPVAVQNEVLGVRKAQLWRSGTPIEKFTSSAGRPLTLEELDALPI